MEEKINPGKEAEGRKKQVWDTTRGTESVRETKWGGCQKVARQAKLHVLPLYTGVSNPSPRKIQIQRREKC